MRLPWLHPHRVEVLTALALVAGQGGDLLPGFRSLARDDPSLRPWIRCFEPLERGAALVPLLRRLRLVDSYQVAYLESRYGSPSFARVLANCAHGNRGRLPGMVLLRWYPLWVVLALLAAPVALTAVLEWYGDAALGRIYADLGIRLSGLSGFVFGVALPWQILTVLGVMAAVAAAILACHALPWAMILLTPWAPAMWREAAACRLIHLAQCERWERVPFHQRLLLRGAAWLRRDPDALGPGWAQDWRLFWCLSWFKVPRRRRMASAALADELGLVGRLQALGLVPLGERGVVDWDEAAQRARLRYEAARERVLPWLRTVLLIAGVWACYSALIAPLFDIVNRLGGGWGPPRNSVAELAWWLPMAAAITLALACLRSFPWPPSLIFVTVGNQPDASSLICLAVAAALRRREDLGEALEALYPSLPLVYRFRIGAAVASLREHGGQPVSRVLEEELLLPPAIARALAAAESLGPEALARAAEVEASGLARAPTTGSSAVTATFSAYLFIALVAFIGVFIAPKFLKIMAELGIEAPLSMRALAAVGSHGLLVLLLVIVLALLPIAWSLLIWLWHAVSRRGQRLRRGHLLVEGCAAGLDESALAELVAATWQRAPHELATAASAGDLGGVIAASGWSARDPASLAAQLERQTWRSQRWQRVRNALLVVMLPLLLAVPVLVVGDMILGSILRILESLMEDL